MALAAIPASDAGPGKRVPGAIILISTGDQTGGRSLGMAVAAIEEAGIPVHTVAVGPRGRRRQRQLAQLQHHSIPTC